MKKPISRAVLLLVALVMIATSCGGDDGSLEVQDARYRLSRSDLGAGYMSISNTTSDDVRLESATAEGVGRIELHESLAKDDGTMAMEARPDGFVIAAGQTITLEPGGKHLMLFDPTGTDDLTLFLDFGDATIEVVAEFDADASASMDDDAMGDMDDTDHSDDDALDDGAMDDSDT